MRGSHAQNGVSTAQNAAAQTDAYASYPSSPASDVSRKGNSLGTQRVPGYTSPKGEGLDAGVCAAFVFTDA